MSFFLWLSMWVPHPGHQVPVFEDLARAWGKGDPLQRDMIAVAMLAIAVAVFVNLELLVWNLGRHAAFRRSPAYDRLRQTNGEAQLTTLPLAIAINVGFVLGLVFVPGLWSVVE